MSKTLTGRLATALFGSNRSVSAPKRVRQLAVLLLVIAALLLPWILVLGSTLKGQANVRMWSSTWIGLDMLEVAGLCATAVLMLRRNIQVMAAAAFTSAFFLIDSWFDVMLSQAGSDWYQAFFAAFFLELPLCIVCAGIAITAPAWCKDTGDGATLLAFISHRIKRK